MIEVRDYFDRYIVQFCTLRELVEILQYTYLWNHQCIGRVMRKVKEDGIPNRFFAQPKT